MLSVNSFTLTAGRGCVVVKSPWVPQLKHTTQDTPEVSFHGSVRTEHLALTQLEQPGQESMEKSETRHRKEARTWKLKEPVNSEELDFQLKKCLRAKLSLAPTAARPSQEEEEEDAAFGSDAQALTQR